MHTLYHLIECVSKLNDFLPKVNENETKKYKKCPQHPHHPQHSEHPKLYDFNRDDISIMYSCYLHHHFICADKGNDLKCFFKYLNLKVGKVNYSDLKVNASEIEKEFNTNSQFVNERIKFLMFLESASKWAIGRALNSIKQQFSKPEIYVILDYDDKKVCSICLTDDKKKDYIKFPQCSHEFHKECISKLGEEPKTCPLCIKKYEIIKQSYDHNITEKIRLVLENNHKLFDYGKIYFYASQKERDILKKLYNQVSILNSCTSIINDLYYRIQRGFIEIKWDKNTLTPFFAETKIIINKIEKHEDDRRNEKE